MPDVSSIPNVLLLAIGLILFVVKAFALIDCVTRSEARFAAVDTLSKRGWLIILVLALLTHLVDRFNPLGILSLIGTVAAFVYLAQVRGSDSR